MKEQILFSRLSSQRNGNSHPTLPSVIAENGRANNQGAPAGGGKPCLRLDPAVCGIRPFARPGNPSTSRTAELSAIHEGRPRKPWLPRVRGLTRGSDTRVPCPAGGSNKEKRMKIQTRKKDEPSGSPFFLYSMLSIWLLQIQLAAEQIIRDHKVYRCDDRRPQNHHKEHTRSTRRSTQVREQIELIYNIAKER